MPFPIELERSRRGLVFKLREGKPNLVKAKPIGEPFGMNFEDRACGAGDRYGGSPRYGNFGEQFDDEIKKRGLSPEIANAYLMIGPEKEVSAEETLYGNHPPIERPRIVTRTIQLYSLDEKVAEEQRNFISAFVMAWTT